MIDLNITEAKKIRFGIAVSGVQTRDLKGALRMIIDGIEYGFPVSIIDGKITVEIPPLENTMKKDLSEGQKINAKLEVIAGDTFLVPWEDSFKINKPIKIEAVIAEVEDIKEQKPKAKVKLEEIENIKIPLLKKEIRKENETGKKKAKISKFAKILGE